MSRNLTAALVHDLRARIVDGRMSPGERLPSDSSVPAPPPSAAPGNG